MLDYCVYLRVNIAQTNILKMEFNLTYLFSISAITVSIVTIFITRKNLKKQLRLSKLEEMLEILHFLNGYYSSLLRVFIGIEKSIESFQNSNDITDAMKEAIKYRKGLIDTISKETITNKISRLRVLSNAYLKNSSKVSGLKVRIHTVGDVFYHMYMFIFLDGDSNLIRKNENAIIPPPDKMNKFIRKIENDLIVEMNFGYRSIKEDEQENYFQLQFKKDLEI